MTAPATSSIFSETQRPNEAWLAKAVPEAALEPDLPIIDPHHHFWHHKSGYKYFVEELAQDAMASGHKLEATVFVEANAMYRANGPEHLKSVGETEFATGMSAIAASGKYTHIRAAAGIVAYADLMWDDGLLEEALDAHESAANGRLRGIRQRAKADPDPVVAGPVRSGNPNLFQEPQFRKGLKRLAARDLSFDVSIFHPQLHKVIDLARAVPEANLVVIHSASPLGFGSYAGRETEMHAQWHAGMRELAACPNVSVKMGGLLMCLGNFDFSTAERPPTSEELVKLWNPYIADCIELFGAERCMVSSNYPVEKAGLPYGVIWNMFKRVAAGCSDAEKTALFSGTAKRVYRLD
ncbi:amidohydrolase [Hydrogenophaga sp.]|uniref:amidohydrolase family protein n=1 Tax=Hydrogenophaga sp. TaxID=1904254 RepID=UPI00271B0E1F|nr:amidohydrolase family protein [Hydrogenophaga sp.]MDO9437249.1 amidohydrolase family protein [Hydrogenophaga sp.]